FQPVGFLSCIPFVFGAKCKYIVFYLVVNNSIYTIVYNFRSHYHEKKSIKRNLFDFMKIDGTTKSDIQELAIEAGFMKRKPKKIDPFEYLTIMCKYHTTSKSKNTGKGNRYEK
ncbi:MAG: hypothetical protein WCQ26_10455, partial [Pseudanabaena sp. ELA748]